MGRGNRRPLLSSIVYRLSSMLYRPSSIFFRLSSILYRPSSIIHRLSSIVYRLPCLALLPCCCDRAQLKDTHHPYRGRTYKLCADAESAREEWTQAINKAFESFSRIS